MNPDGSRLLQALSACWNADVFVLIPELFAIPSMVNWPDALGSGKLLTPLLRMHCENVTACSRLAVELVVELVAPGVLDPHALAKTAIATRATSATGRCDLFMMDRRASSTATRISLW
jgi:hypothetical protein